VLVSRLPVPADALLKTYPGGRHPERWGHYGDCFSVTVDADVTLEGFVFAFYTSWVFKKERFILRLLGAPSSDTQARGVAQGTRTEFAVWRVGERNASQLLMCDRYEFTRSWFRVEPLDGGQTRLQFGTGVAAMPAGNAGVLTMSRGFRLLSSFHVHYSKVLLRAAAVRAAKLANASRPRST
jgi:hypothetical protein